MIVRVYLLVTYNLVDYIMCCNLIDYNLLTLANSQLFCLLSLQKMQKSISF